MYLWFARFVSGSALFLCSLFAGTASASANDDTVVMQVGRNTKTMHPDLRAMRFVTEPPTEDEDWAYSIVINAIFHEHTRGNTKIDVPILRDVTNVGGAYGVIHKGERYMLVSRNYRYNMVVIGHELGHHVCGHFEKLGTSRELELEADKFAGAFARAVHDHAYPSPSETARYGEDGWYEIMRNEAAKKTIFQTADMIYTPMLPSDTHPPANERINSFKVGYERGSDCLSRKVLEVR